MTRIAILQMTAGVDPDANSELLINAIVAARRDGASMLFTPEYSGQLDSNLDSAKLAITGEAESAVVKAVCDAARREGIWVAVGSHMLFDEDGHLRNRSLLIDPKGQVRARYDKIHMFDVSLGQSETWRESEHFRAGEQVVAVETPAGLLGLTICYDVRFPGLFQELGLLGCDVMAVPAAFTPTTGASHWHALLRARAIEASAYVVAAAQVGQHEDGKCSYGHSLVVDPWGKVILDLGGEAPGLGFADIDRQLIDSVRASLPSLSNRRAGYGEST